MGDERQCRTCRWWKRLGEGEIEDDNDEGTCHRFPPSMVFMQALKSPNGYMIDGSGLGDFGWPVTLAHEACGEWSNRNG